MKVAILDVYQDVALSMADWSAVGARADITVFNDHLADQDAVVKRLAPFEVVCVVPERTALPRSVLERPAELKMTRWSAIRSRSAASRSRLSKSS